MFYKEKTERKMENNQWVFIPTTNGLYQINAVGEVRRITKNLMRYSQLIYQTDSFENCTQETKVVKYMSQDMMVPYVKIWNKEQGPQEIPVSVLMFWSFFGIRNINHTEIFI